MRLSGSPPGRWRGSGDDRWVWIEDFGRHWNRAKLSTGLGYPDTRRCGSRQLAGRDSSSGLESGAPLSLTPLSALNEQHEHHALSRFFPPNILELITCHLIRHKSAEMPPKVPFHFSLLDSVTLYFDATW